MQMAALKVNADSCYGEHEGEEVYGTAQSGQ